MSRSTSSGWTRREALEILGMSAAAAVLPDVASAQSVTFPKGAIIRTVLKDYAPEELAGGATLFHEHMSLAPDFLPRWMKFAAETRAANAPPAGAGAGGGRGTGGGRAGGPPAPEPSGPYFMQDVDLMTEELSIAKREGIACIVDGGHPDMGRDVKFLREISTRSGLPIVLGGGFYTQPFYPKEISTMSEEQVVQAILRQVDADPIGVFGEIGSWDLMTADERKVFRAIGKAHVATNIPIFTHTGIRGLLRSSNSTCSKTSA